MPPQININELYSIQKKKKQKRTVCFDKILELCHNRIKYIAESNGQNTFYEIPGILAGYPLYNLYECLDYVVDALRKNGFLVQILPKPHIAVIYISWDPEELKPPKPTATKQIKPRQQIALQQKEYMDNSTALTQFNQNNTSLYNNNTLYNNNSLYNDNTSSYNNDNLVYNPNTFHTKNKSNKIVQSKNNKNKLALPSVETRTMQSEPFYLASLRLF
jgi:hypothetical protein